MESSIFVTFLPPLSRSLEVAVLAVEEGEPIPLDVAAELMEQGVDMEKFERHLERL